MMARRFLLFVVILTILSCGKSGSTPDQPQEEETLSLEFSEKSFSNKAAEFTIDVLANCEWSFFVDVDWAYVVEPKAQYNGPKALTICVLKNETTSSRTATFVFTFAKGTKTLKVSQEGLDVYLNVNETELSFGYRTAEKVINITSNCGWDAKSDKTWLILKPVTGLLGSFDVTVNVETNNTKEARSATITIWNETYSLTRVVNVVQSGQAEINEKDYIDDNGINWGKGIIIRGLSWAPVNHGYHSENFLFGKMFQWGRKNGIGYHSEVFNDSGTTRINDVWTGVNGDEDPSTFYKYGDNSKFNYDWILAGDDSFWNKGTEENPLKNAQYDPCPDGWRIPTAFEFKSLIDYAEKRWVERNGIKGYEFYQTGQEESSQILFLPAAGRLNTVDGLSYDRGIEGYYWTITANAGNSGYLFFYNESCSVNYQGSRAGGCSIRCVKE